MTLEVDVQIASEEDDLPDPESLRAWADAAISGLRGDAELTVRIVDEDEGARLNSRFRKSSGATNVLSFPFEPPPGVSVSLLGDIVICAPVVRREAGEQSKSLSSHWAHMVVHGALHLLGYDHQRAADADKMEAMEAHILGELGFDNPYESRGIS
jgi:probable rRNA maturation factor